MSEVNFYRDKILKYIYLQPEIEVSIEKVNRKFAKITIDELNDLLQQLDDENLITLGPSNSLEFVTTGVVLPNGDSVTYEEPIKPKITSTYSSVILTLSGREIVEHNRKLLMKSRLALVANPAISYFVTYGLGLITPSIFGWIIHLFIK